MEISTFFKDFTLPVWKSQTAGKSQMVMGLVPQLGFQLLRPWTPLEKPGLLGANGLHLSEEGKGIFGL